MALPGTLSAAGTEWTPSTSVAGTSTSSWHKRYVKNVTRGVSSLLWGHPKKPDAASYDSPPLHSFRPVINWSHVTYPPQESVPTLDFYVARKAVMAKKSKSVVTEPGASAKSPPLLHRRLARIAFQLTPPLMLDAPCGFGSEAGDHNSKLTTSGRLDAARSRSRLSGSSVTGASGVGSGGSGENVYRCVEALGVISVRPFVVIRTDLFGTETHRVDFKVTHLLHACFGEVLGIGEVLICVTAAFTIAVCRVRDLQLLYDIPVHLAENLWMRYYRRHTRAPPSNLNNCAITTLAVSPSTFSRRHGLIAVGSCSGLTHVWKIPERMQVGVLPPPISDQQAVAGLAYASVDIVECIKDIASPFGGPDTSDTFLRRNYLVVLYEDGQFAMWAHSLTQLRSGTGDASWRGEEQSTQQDTLFVGHIPPHLQYHFPSIESPLVPTADFALEKLMRWRDGAELGLVSVLECGDCVALFVKVLDRDFAFEFLHPQCSSVVQPLITFQDIGIPIAIHHPAAVCYALLNKQHRSIIVATPGVLRVLELHHADRGMELDCDSETRVTFDMSITLTLLATLPVIRKTEFSKVKYDPDFDELLLGLTTGEVVKIDGLSDLVLGSS